MWVPLPELVITALEVKMAEDANEDDTVEDADSDELHAAVERVIAIHKQKAKSFVDFIYFISLVIL